MFKLKKLNARGVAHHALIMLLIVGAVGSFGAYRVFSTHADASYTYTMPNGCLPGQQPNKNKKGVPTGGCDWKNAAAQVQQDCTTYHLQYDSSKAHCKYNCLPGWHIDGAGPTAGSCVANTGNSNGGSSGGAGGVDCAALKRANGPGNTCGQCYSAFTDPTPADQTDTCQRVCNAPHQFTNNKNACACVTGYSMQSDGTCNVVGSGGGTVGRPNQGGGTPPATDGADQFSCTAQHQVWHAGTGNCGPRMRA